MFLLLGTIPWGAVFFILCQILLIEMTRELAVVSLLLVALQLIGASFYIRKEGQ